MDLIVVRSFGAYAPGDRIADAAAVARVLAGEHADHVVRVAAMPAAGKTGKGG